MSAAADPLPAIIWLFDTGRRRKQLHSDDADLTFRLSTSADLAVFSRLAMVVRASEIDFGVLASE
jgi:hypothetical protein